MLIVCDQRTEKMTDKESDDRINILCYGDSNTWGCKPIATLDQMFRYNYDQRWTGVLRQELGAGYTIIEEGLNGRTTVFDDPVIGADRNGKTYLEPCLQSHMPLDLVIIMLGTNDLKPRFSSTVFDIAGGTSALLSVIARRPTEWIGKIPETLLIAPPPLGKLSALADMFEGSAALSEKLGAALRTVALRCGSHFLNAGDHIKSSPVDGVHLELEDHRLLGHAVAQQVRKICP